jgi:hypothetical protein
MCVSDFSLLAAQLFRQAGRRKKDPQLIHVIKFFLKATLCMYLHTLLSSVKYQLICGCNAKF